MTPEAENAVAEFAADCGADIYQMTQSCETYLQQYLANFPAEQELMIAALRVGVPTRIAAHDARAGYDDFLSELGEKFAEAAHTDADAAKWTVGAWAFALGKPVGYVPPELRADGGRVYRDARPDKYAAVGDALVTGIAVSGAFIGGFLAFALMPVLWLAVDVHFALMEDHLAEDEVKAHMPSMIVCTIAGLVNGVLATAAAYGGWRYGRGDSRPWQTFGATLGTSLFSAWMYMLIVFIPLPITFIFYYASIFMVTFKTAARGVDY